MVWRLYSRPIVWYGDLTIGLLYGMETSQYIGLLYGMETSQKAYCMVWRLHSRPIVWYGDLQARRLGGGGGGRWVRSNPPARPN